MGIAVDWDASTDSIEVQPVALQPDVADRDKLNKRFKTQLKAVVYEATKSTKARSGSIAGTPHKQPATRTYPPDAPRLGGIKLRSGTLTGDSLQAANIPCVRTPGAAKKHGFTRLATPGVPQAYHDPEPISAVSRITRSSSTEDLSRNLEKMVPVNPSGLGMTGGVMQKNGQPVAVAVLDVAAGVSEGVVRPARSLIANCDIRNNFKIAGFKGTPIQPVLYNEKKWAYVDLSEYKLAGTPPPPQDAGCYASNKEGAKAVFFYDTLWADAVWYCANHKDTDAPAELRAVPGSPTDIGLYSRRLIRRGREICHTYTGCTEQGFKDEAARKQQKKKNLKKKKK